MFTQTLPTIFPFNIVRISRGKSTSQTTRWALRNSSRMAQNANGIMSDDHKTPPSSAPGENFEVRQVSDSADWKPDPSKSIPLPKNRQALIDDIIALYSCQPTVDRVKRYTRDCVYDDQFVYANNRYKMAGQWFALPKLFKDSHNVGYEIIKNEENLIQFKNEQSWTFAGIPKTTVINALVSLSLDPATSGADSEFVQIKYHKDQANEKEYSHSGLGFLFKKFQADHVSDWMSSPEVQQFKKDQGPELEESVRTHGTADAHDKVN